MNEKLVAIGSGNVFADLGVPHPDEHLEKARLVAAISKAIPERGLTRMQASRIAGMPQTRMSELLKGRFRDLGSDYLRRVLGSLGATADQVPVNQSQLGT